MTDFASAVIHVGASMDVKAFLMLSIPGWRFRRRWNAAANLDQRRGSDGLIDLAKGIHPRLLRIPVGGLGRLDAIPGENLRRGLLEATHAADDCQRLKLCH